MNETKAPIPKPAHAPMYKELEMDHKEIFRKKSSNTFNGREMTVNLIGLRCAPDPEMRINTQELAMAVAMKLLALHQKQIREGSLPKELDPEYFMESMNRGWLQSYMMIPLARAIAALAPVYKDKEFNIILKFQYFRKAAGKEFGMYVFDRNIQVDAYQGPEQQRHNVRRLADDRYTARFHEHYNS